VAHHVEVLVGGDDGVASGREDRDHGTAPADAERDSPDLPAASMYLLAALSPLVGAGFYQRARRLRSSSPP
jgi:hypothetical protein